MELEQPGPWRRVFDMIQNEMNIPNDFYDWSKVPVGSNFTLSFERRAGLDNCCKGIIMYRICRVICLIGAASLYS